MARVQVQGLGKAYQIYRRPIDSLKEVLLRRQLSQTHWAVRDVGFTLGPGESLGIIGDNGAGKTTLLRMIAGVLQPSEGAVVHQGRVSAMLQLGAGFHPDLSGIENIRIGCAVLGLSPRETEALLPAIADFAELGDFLARPLRTYSSGMSLRLGFAVATAVAPDVLVVDEHLSVGDQHFQFKCMRHIMQLREAGCALVFCSHNVYAVRQACLRTLWLHEGRPQMLGPTEEVVAAYQSHVRSRQASAAPAAAPAAVPAAPAAADAHPADNWFGECTLEATLKDGAVETGSRIALQVRAHLSETAWRDGVHLGVLITRNDGLYCHGVSTQYDGMERGLQPLGGGVYGVRFVIDALPLLAGQYAFTLALMDGRSPMIYSSAADVCPFTVRHAGGDVGVVRIAHRWDHGG